MKWNRFTIKTKTEAEDMIICTLAEIGVEGVEIQDHQPLTEEDKAQMFVDIMPEGPADDGIAYLNFYLEEDADKENIDADGYMHISGPGHIRHARIWSGRMAAGYCAAMVLYGA